jgi:hypothetical protein
LLPMNPAIRPRIIQLTIPMCRLPRIPDAGASKFVAHAANFSAREISRIRAGFRAYP